MNLNDGTTTWGHPIFSYNLSDRRTDVDVVAVHAFLTQSYWSNGIPLETVRRSVDGAHCFSLFDQERRQVGFARVISDHATMAYLGDVYVLESHRGQGLARWMMECILAHPDLQALRRWLLATRDMHPLYGKLGFAELKEPSKFMEMRPERGYG